MTRTFAERLGFSGGARVVIFHVDDAGMSFESNEGVFQAVRDGIATSCSVMMPCPWAPGFMKRWISTGDLDVGIHATLTSEWPDYRWGPLAGADQVPGLVDEEGAFHRSVPLLIQHATADEVAREVRAQIRRFRAFGREPTHIDSHMFSAFPQKFVEAYANVGIAESIPVMLPSGHATTFNAIRTRRNQRFDRDLDLRLSEALWDAGLPAIDDIDPRSYDWSLPADVPATDANLRTYKVERLVSMLGGLEPGITVLLLHCVKRSDVFEHITTSLPTRLSDLLATVDPELRRVVDSKQIQVTTWRELKERRARAT